MRAAVCTSLLSVWLPAATRPALSAESAGVETFINLASESKRTAISTTRLRAEVEPLASIRDENTVTFRGRNFSFHSVVPVFEGERAGGYLALLQRWGYPPDYDDDRWDLIKPAERDITCVSGVGADQGEFPVEIHGGESRRPAKSYFVIRCPVPAASFGERCHEATLKDRGEVIGKVRGCQVDADTKLDQVNASKLRSTVTTRRKYGLAACVKPVYHSDEDPWRSGVLKLPQWLEYNAMHGVEHFLVYTFTKSYPEDRKLTLDIIAPYLAQGMVSLVDIDEDYNHTAAQWGAHDQVINDCLYRMKSRAEWLLPSIDVDEYITWHGMGQRASFLEAAEKHARPGLFSLTMQRYDFTSAPDPFSQLDIQATRREVELSDLSPKFLVRPRLAHNMFIHWVVTGTDESRDNNLSLNPTDLCVFHYKLNPNMPTKAFRNETTDSMLAAFVEPLAKRVHTRYGFPFPKVVQGVLAELQERAGAQSMLALSGGRGGLPSKELDPEEPFARMFPEFAQHLRPK